MTQLLVTTDKSWLKKWDDFVAREPKASHLMLSSWNASFASYGFGHEAVILHEAGAIVGGYMAVVARFSVFRFYIVPFGPVTSEGFESGLNRLVASVRENAMARGCCYAHVAIPFSETETRHAFNRLPPISALESASEGHRFKYVYSSNGLNWIDLGFSDEESLLQHFGMVTRRNIRSALRKGLEVKLLNRPEEIEAGYALCLENARENGYSLRDWPSFKNTLLDMIGEGSATFIAATKDGELKGAVLLVAAGNYNTYILGGSKKEKPDLLAGHFLQWQAILHTYRAGMDGYNISLGGSPGVMALKNAYADSQILFTRSKYHWVLRPLHFRFYLFMAEKLGRHKKLISVILSKLKRK